MDKSQITLEKLRSFVRVAERNSLSAVAREFGLGQSTITRHIGELEKALGVTLLNRTTRRVSLTAEGERYLDDARTILRLVDEATDNVLTAGGRLAGSIKISCTAALGIRHVQRCLFAFQDQHPDISIDLSLSDIRIDLVRDAVDIAIRLGPLADSSLQRKHVGHSRRILVASKDYLAAHGRPLTIADLSQHQAIRMSNIEGSRRFVLTARNGEISTIPAHGRLTVDHGLAARDAVLQGRGIAAAHLWLIDDLLDAGIVEQILPDYSPEPVPLSMLFVPGRARTRRVRALIDVLDTALKAVPGIS